MSDLTRRDFVKLAGVVVATAAVPQVTAMSRACAQARVVGSTQVSAGKGSESRARVYFTKTMDADHLIKLYQQVSDGIYGKIAVKLHTGEKTGPNILPRDMVQKFMQVIPWAATAVR